MDESAGGHDAMVGIRASRIATVRRRVASWAGKKVASVAALWRSAAILWGMRRELRAAARIVIMPEGGFGHTIIAPDAFRRLYTGQRLVFLVVQNPNQNPEVATLWPDLRMEFLPFVHTVRFAGRDVTWDASWVQRHHAGRLLTMLLRATTRARVYRTINEMYEEVAAVRPTPAVAARGGHPWRAGWAELLLHADVGPARLPPDVERPIREKIREFLGPDVDPTRGFCALYLRTKGEGSDVRSDTTRIGAPFEDYVPSIHALVDAGFVVLITGDRQPDDRFRGMCDGRVVAPAWIGVDAKRFSLFASTAVDAWVGNFGGGTCLPTVNRIPSLVVEAFPFGGGIPHARMHYKTVQDANGRLVPYSVLFDRYAHDHELGGLTLCSSTPEELREAVAEFIMALDGRVDDGVGKEILRGLPDHVIDKYAGSRLSRAWLAQYGVPPHTSASRSTAVAARPGS